MIRRPTPAIILAHGLNGLGAVRSLGIEGIPVSAMVGSTSEPCFRSRFARTFLRGPSETLHAALERLRREHAIDEAVVLPTGDIAVSELADCRDDLPRAFRTVLPPRRTLETLLDKRLELETLVNFGASLPDSVTRLDTSPDSPLMHLRLPVIFKPRTQRDANDFGFKNRVVYRKEQLDSFLEEQSKVLGRFVAQGVIEGADSHTWVCNATFNSRSELLCGFTFQRLGMSPPHFGVTTMALSTRNERVLDETCRIARALAYTGPGMFEFKWDPRVQTYRYIETNPRLGMCNWFDTSCGVNNVYRAYRLALGDETGTSLGQTEQRYFIDLYSDLYSRLVGDRQPVAEVARLYLGLIRVGRVGAFWSGRDPAPGFAAVGRKARYVMRGARRKMRHPS